MAGSIAPTRISVKTKKLVGVFEEQVCVQDVRDMLAGPMGEPIRSPVP
jgi:hypothetical protein